jgi:hypothetical protein
MIRESCLICIVPHQREERSVFAKLGRLTRPHHLWESMTKDSQSLMSLSSGYTLDPFVHLNPGRRSFVTSIDIKERHPHCGIYYYASDFVQSYLNKSERNEVVRNSITPALPNTNRYFCDCTKTRKNLILLSL